MIGATQHDQYSAKPSPPAPLSLYQGRGGVVNLLSCWLNADVNERLRQESIVSTARFRKTCFRKTCRRRNGIVVIVMVIVLGGLAIALLTLAGQTSIQMKSIRNTSLDTQQCNELIALGEKILAARLLANPEFSNEIIRVDLPQSFAVANQPRPQIGIVELTMIEKSDTDTDAQHVWTIHASFGASEGQLKHASRNVYPRTEKK